MLLTLRILNMNKLAVFLIGLVGLSGCANNEYRIEANLAEKFNDKVVVLASYDDTVVIDSAKVVKGKVVLNGKAESPRLAQIMIDGRTRAYVVVEPGLIEISDSTYVASGTKLNNRLKDIICRMDSVESLDDMDLYIDFVKGQYEANKENVLGLFFATEYVRFNDLEEIDTLLLSATDDIKNSRRVKRYRDAAELRASTAVGKQYVDFYAVQPNGKEMRLGDIVGKGNYVLVDFFASWCPYCIKEFPALKEIYSNYKDKGFEIVGVAVRDKVEDTKNTVDKYDLKWTIMYNAERKPYEIYGFTGIPHLILFDGTGKIVCRGESPKQISERLRVIYEDETIKK